MICANTSVQYVCIYIYLFLVCDFFFFHNYFENRFSFAEHTACSETKLVILNTKFNEICNFARVYTNIINLIKLNKCECIWLEAD